MDSGLLSGIALVITALLAPFVTKYAAGGQHAKAEQAEAEAALKVALADNARERASGQRWYRLFVEWHTAARTERHARTDDRQVMRMFPGAPNIPWEPLPPFAKLEDVIAEATPDA